jgi:hypothetical protein
MNDKFDSNNETTNPAGQDCFEHAEADLARATAELEHAEADVEKAEAEVREAEAHGHHPHHEHKEEFCFEFDTKGYETKHHEVTPQQIREIVGGIASTVTIVEIMEDGTQRTLQEGQEVHLHRCSKFRKLPRFTRGRGRVGIDLQAVLKEYPSAVVGLNDEYFILPTFQLPGLYTQTNTDLLIVIPPTYPAAPPDNFYVPWGLSLKSGQAIKDYTGPANLYGREWGTFSHHVDVKTWNGEGGDSFLTFIATAIARLQEGA